MGTVRRVLELDAETDARIETISARTGRDAAAVVADALQLLDSAIDADRPQTPSTDEVAELDRRWAAIEAGEATVSNDDVVRWLRTWGSPAFKSWHDQ